MYAIRSYYVYRGVDDNELIPQGEKKNRMYTLANKK